MNNMKENKDSMFTRRRPRLVMAQLSPAVGAAGVDAAIVEQEEGVHPAASHVPQPPAAEHAAPLGLKGGARLTGDAQLSVLGITPAQHVGQGEGRAPISASGQRGVAHATGRPNTRFRLDRSPAFSFSRECRPWEESQERVMIPSDDSCQV